MGDATWTMPDGTVKVLGSAASAHWSPMAPAALTRRQLWRFARRVLRALGMGEWKVTVGPVARYWPQSAWLGVLGTCDYTSRHITVLPPAEYPWGYTAQETVLHEIAHAMGPVNDGHGKAFRHRHGKLIKRFLAAAKGEGDG